MPNDPHLYAQLAEAAYFDFSNLGRRLRLLGFHLTRTYDEGGTQAYMATDGACVVVVFRGSEEARDFWADLKYIKTDWPRGPGRVHQGFLQAFLQVRDMIQVDLERYHYHLPKVFIGHSLGAALAVLAGATWQGVYHVYGCPRVGNTEFADHYLSTGTRYETWFDVVTFVPPKTSPRQALHSWRHHRPVTLYKHVGVKVGVPARGHSISGYVKGLDKSE